MSVRPREPRSITQSHPLSCPCDCSSPLLICSRPFGNRTTQLRYVTLARFFPLLRSFKATFNVTHCPSRHVLRRPGSCCAGVWAGRRSRDSVPLQSLCHQRRAEADCAGVKASLSGGIGDAFGWKHSDRTLSTQEAISAKGYGAITTEIEDAPTFYYAEDYHQQYLDKPGNRQYCGAQPTGPLRALLCVCVMNGIWLTAVCNRGSAPAALVLAAAGGRQEQDQGE